MSTTIPDAAQAKEPSTSAPPPAVAPAPAEPPKPAVAPVAQAAPAPAPVVEAPKALEPKADELRAELATQLEQVREINRRHRERTILGTLARMGASGVSDATLLMLVPREVDPETPAGLAALDKIREQNPGIFRPQAPDESATIAATAKAAKAPQGYAGRYGDDYAERLARGVFERSGVRR